MKIERAIPIGIVAKVLDGDLEVREFDRKPYYYVHFWTNTQVKGMNPPAMG